MKPTTKARLTTKSELSSEVCAFTFEAEDQAFTGLEPGAHIDVHLNSGLIRNYSLTEWDDAGRWLSVAVKKEPAGRGGSAAMHDLKVDDVLELGGPRNNFPLRSGGEPIVLLGGGIGITPLYSMARKLLEQGREFDVHYMTRNQALAAFDPQFRALRLGKRYRLHCDEGTGRPDFGQLVESYPESTHYYVCGPEPMLNAVTEASRASARGTVFFERFAAAQAPTREARELPFQVVLASTGDEFEVPAEKSILQVLREAGRDVDYGCSEGVCGTCITDVLEGAVDHRDSILTEEEKAAGDCLAICVSRARCARLVLDL